MKIRPNLALAPLAIAITLTLAGCGGSSDSTVSASITGTVTAPSGSLAQLQNRSWYTQLASLLIADTQAAIIGVAPVAGATVELVQIDDSGNVVGGVLASATTASDGSYTLVTDITPSPAYQLRVGSGSAAIRAPLAFTSVDINPVTEAVVRTIMTKLTSGATLASFTTLELKSLVNYMAAQDIDFSATSTIAAAINKINTDVPGLEQLADTLANAAPTTAVSGNFGLYGISSILEIDLDTSENSHTDANYPGYTFYDWNNWFTLGAAGLHYSASFNSGGALTLNTNEETVLMQQAYDFIAQDGGAGRNAASLYNFRSVKTTTTSSDTFSGTYVDGNSNMLINVDGRTYAANRALDGNLIAIAARAAGDDTINGKKIAFNYHTLLMGIKESTSQPDISGSYNVVYYNHDSLSTVNADPASPAVPVWDYSEVAASTGEGTLSLVTGAFNVTDRTLTMAMPGTISTASSSANASYAITVAANGRLSIGSSVVGQVSPDGNVFTFQNRNGSATPASESMVLGVRAGSGMSNATLNGSYQMIAMSSDHNCTSDCALDGNGSSSNDQYVITFNGAGSVTVTGGTTNDASLSNSNNSARDFQLQQRSQAASGSGTYTLASDGTFGATAVGTQFRGALSSDGNTLILTSVSGNSYGLHVGFKK